MKRKVLGIAISLAMLSSLFVFAVPVTAKNDTNDKFFDFWAWLGDRTGSDSSNLTSEWFGAPGVYQGEELPGVVWKYKGRLFFYPLTAESTFGPGEATLEYNVGINWQTGKLVEHSTWTLTWDNPEYQGTLTVCRDTHRDFVSWVSPPMRANWEHKVDHWAVQGATGDLKGLHFSTITDEAGGGFIYGVAHFAP